LAYFGGDFPEKVHFSRILAFAEQNYGFGATFTFFHEKSLLERRVAPRGKMAPQNG